MANIFHARCVILKMSVHSLVIAREWQVIGMPSPEMKRNFLYVVNNKFLGKWYGRHPWIQLVMECESMVEKGINFILCLGTAYDLPSMEDIENSQLFLLTGKHCVSKQIYLSI